MNSENMIITEFVSEANWMYFWGKYVTGVNLNNHCAKSLIGTYTTKFNSDTKKLNDIVLDEADSDIFYICGVSKPYRYNRNFHLALRKSIGKKVSYCKNGITIKVLNAEILPIVFDVKECQHPKAAAKEFATCRNWQFAYLYQNLFCNTITENVTE